MGLEEKKKVARTKRPKVVLLKDLASEDAFDKVTGGDARRKLVFGERCAKDQGATEKPAND